MTRRGKGPSLQRALRVASIAALSCGVAVGGELKDGARLGNGLRIVAVHPGRDGGSVVAGTSPSYPYHRPRLAGFSPLIAITTSNKHSLDDIDYEHNLEDFYDCNAYGPPSASCGALNPPADQNFVVGILDSGSVVDLAAGSGAALLGIEGPYVTDNTLEIGGVGGSVTARVSQPIGIYAAGLSAVQGGVLDLNAVVGHSNTSALVAPSIVCNGAEVVTAIIGTPFLSFYTSVIRVDTPRELIVGDRVFHSPDIQVQFASDPVPEFPRGFTMELGGISPVATASYFPVLDPEDLVTPAIPTQLSLSPLSIPTGGVFFKDVQLLMGEPSPTNLPITVRMMVDTGAQSSIISPGTAAELNLPLEPDFTLDACGVGGLVEGIPGYHIDYLKISALGGALEYSRVPVVVLDLPSPEGGPMEGVMGMNLFWNRSVIFEPSLIVSSFFHVSDPVPVPFGDSDVNLQVDLGDAAYFAACRTAPDAQIASPECDHLDRLFDGDVDLADFAALQNCFSGLSPADAACGQ